ncbi:MAG: DUF362 domain-containing protein [Coriobacteriales bacterium]|nr:DUF362 domain-containing protein [Coriobacteriales bacterium]
MAIHACTPATGGDTYIAPQDRDGGKSTVFFTRDLSAAGLRKAFAKVADKLDGRVAIKLHTGEKDGPNIIPREWVADLVAQDLPEAKIVETNTYYAGDRDTTEKHRDTIAHNGWTFCPVDITDENGYIEWPVEGGKWFDTMAMGANLANYDSMLTLTHFKGHMMGGFGGSNKNLGIGCASGKEGKKWIHAQTSDNGATWGAQWSVANEELMEKITESTKATIDHFGTKIVYINILRNMSVSCDCEGTAAQPVVTPNVGILASTDICAIDSASVDLVVAMTNAGLVHNHDLVERMTSRHGFRQLSYMHELGMGNWKYTLCDLDNNEAEVSLADAVAHVVPFAG